MIVAYLSRRAMRPFNGFRSVSFLFHDGRAEVCTVEQWAWSEEDPWRWAPQWGPPDAA